MSEQTLSVDDELQWVHDQVELLRRGRSGLRVRWPAELRQRVLALRSKVPTQTIARKSGLDAAAIYAWASHARSQADVEPAPQVMRVVEETCGRSAQKPKQSTAGVDGVEIRVGALVITVRAAAC
jgi:transposase-like protein